MAIGAAAAAAAVVALATWYVVDTVREVDQDLDHRIARKVPCTEGMRFAGLDGLPPGARDSRCRMLSGIDTLYDVRFRIPRTDLTAWLERTYPHTKLTADACLQHKADACAQFSPAPASGAKAHVIDLNVTYESGNSARVRFAPFTT
ncbi:hypothetical protein ACFYYR_13040 [Streptomyces sp. NPDC001922]|uniref:hypothetical protein n=1 Tax=Streptomyces sp. NPDC001922 TaxID=3364624 RepID=UPI00369649F2